MYQCLLLENTDIKEEKFMHIFFSGRHVNAYCNNKLSLRKWDGHENHGDSDTSHIGPPFLPWIVPQLPFFADWISFC